MSKTWDFTFLFIRSVDSEGIKRWNHATEMLKEHNNSQWHRDAVITSRMAEQAASHQNVLQMQRSVAAKEAEERRLRNRDVLLKLIRSVYFMAQNYIPHTTTYRSLVELLIANGDELLKHHIEHGPGNAQYTSSFSATNIIKAIDTWVDQIGK